MSPRINGIGASGHGLLANACIRKSSRFSLPRCFLGITSAVFAVAAGSTALTGAPSAVTAGIAFLAAALAATHAIANPDARRTGYLRLSADYDDLARTARVKLLCPTASSEEQYAALADLNAAMHRLDREAANATQGQG
jgi:hypothetical protein